MFLTFSDLLVNGAFMRSRQISRVVLVGAVLTAAACTKSTEGPVATSIAVTPATSLSFAALNLTQKLTAKVLDQHGDSMPGLVVTWSSGSATVASVDATGLVTAKGNGSTAITATSGTIHTNVPCAVAQTASTISVLTGDGQVNVAGTTLPVPLGVRVTDALGSPVAGVSVGFAVSVGGGNLSATSATTNATGDATTNWTLGTIAGSQQVAASSGALAPAIFSAMANAGPAKNIAVAGGNNQSYATNAPVPIPPSAKVTDQYGNVVSGASVLFSVTAGGGSVTGANQTTNASGVSTVGSWTLGAAAGTNKLKAALTAAVDTTLFTATAKTPAAPATVTILAGNSQTGLVGYPVNVRPAIQVTDATGLPVNNVAVTFAVSTGGGSVAGGSATTNVNGIAVAGNWTIGAGAGSNTMTATVTGSGITGNPATFTTTGALPTFNITLQNIGPALSPAVQLAFDSAVAKWQRIIYQDVPDIANFAVAAGTCGNSPAIGPVTVDDVLILMKFDSIDGPGKILGQSGPCYIRNTGFLTIMGTMQFDTADVATLIANGSLNSVILHEMGHVLGFGTLWGPSYFACLQNASSAGSPLDTYYSCPRARAEFDSIGGFNYTGGSKVPVENCGAASPSTCGAGTVNSHWREPTFVNELMTGYLNNGVANPLSILTIGSMEDLGYIVNYSAADPYVHVFSSPTAFAATRTLIDLGDDIYHIPIYLVDRAGHVTRVIQP